MATVPGEPGGTEIEGPVEPATKPEPEVHQDFICIHGKERHAPADAIRAEVKERLAAQTRGRVEVTDVNFLSAIVSDLHWHWGVSITGIPHDQWSAIETETYDGKVKTWIQCDRVEDGIAATWKFYADRGVRYWPDDDDDDDDDERVS